VSNKFTAVYYVNKFKEDDESFGHELLGLEVLFESFYEDNEVLGEYTPTYTHVTESLLHDHPSGHYRAFVAGRLVYTRDFYGEVDVEDVIEYSSVKEVPPDCEYY
jgi:hypothetical protein